MAGKFKPALVLLDKNRIVTLIKYSTFVLVAIVLATAVMRFSWESFEGLFSLEFVMSLGGILLGLNVFYYAFLLVLAYFMYKPHRTLSDEELPSCTVIVPAYNEGKTVLKSLDSILASDYPADKLEILAIDDGSVDDTWYWIKLAVARSEGRITPIKLEKNGGKRRALYRGIRQSTSEVIVTVDSDSVVAADTLRQLNSPFIDSKIGGVAGDIRVLNIQDGILPRMMDVNFVFGFEIMRSAQSVLRSVFCTPGALSAYRRTAMLPFLDEWVEQKFFGEPAHIAEDRALATYLMSEGHRIVFQRDAIAHTMIPTDYRTTCKMLMRWGRGDVRETCSMYRFAFRKLDWFHLGIQFNLLMQTMWLFLPVLFLPLTVMALCAAPVAFIQAVILGMIIWSSIPAFVYSTRRCSSEAIFAYTFAVFKFFFLFWVDPYCLVTVRNSKWMTRTRTVRPQPVLRRNFSSSNPQAL